MHCLIRNCLVTGLLSGLLIICAVARAADSPFHVILPYVDGQTFLIGRLDVQQLPLRDLKSRLQQLLAQITDDPSVLPQNIASAVDNAIRLRDRFLEVGGQDLFVIASAADIPQLFPFLVVTVSDPQKAGDLEALLNELNDLLGDAWSVQRAGDRVFLVGLPRTLERLTSPQTAARPELLAAADATAAVSAPIQLLLVPSADQHRVLKETLPKFPPPWQEVTGPTLSDGMQWGMLTVTAAPHIQVRLVFQSRDAAAAEAFAHMLDTSLDALVQLPFVQQAVPEVGALRKLIAPSVAGAQVSLAVIEDAATLQALSKPVAAVIDTLRVKSVNNFKQIGLAMHNYHDVYKGFPSAASFDAAGKPLLSWRVHLLPFLDQVDLYRQFHLDEPWDSEHNQKLIALMPPVFADPAASLQPGMTTYLVPIGEGTVFGTGESLKLNEIRDGTSNTIMVVNVMPDRAVVWTKPADLAVTEAAPLTGLISDSRQEFEVLLCDGSVRVLNNTLDPRILWLMFHANDGKPQP
ncbi:MAG: DUF1559 domain-containing protein [Planctomycetaceae bacterium]|nr:DUF1559 domain-containing protein [Planctomycetaceae bacterium]